MVTGLYLRDFRGLRTAKVDGLARINLLVGPNNSGKTALLEAIYLACCVGRSCNAQIDGKFRSVWLSSPDFLNEPPVPRLWGKHLHAPSPLLAKVRADPTGSYRFDLRLSQKGPVRALALSPSDGSLVDDWPESVLQQLVHVGFDLRPSDVSEGPLLRMLLPQATVSSVDPVRTIYFWDRPMTHDFVGHAAWVLTGAMPAAAHTFFYDAQKTLEHLPTEFYSRMLRLVPGWTQKIAERLGRVLGLTEPFNVLFMPTGPERQWMQGQIAPPDRPALPIDDFGDGARAVFKVLAPLVALSEQVSEEAPGVFLWEEPELFQNPVTLGRLLAEVADLAKNRPLQVFIATHSLEVVAHLVAQAERGTLATGDLCTLRTHLHQGTFTGSPFSVADVRRWTEMRLDVRVPDGKSESPLSVTLSDPPGGGAASTGADEDA